MLKDLEQFIQNFIWTGNCFRRKIVAPSIEDMCRPFEEGGLQSEKFESFKSGCSLEDHLGFSLLGFVKTQLNITTSGLVGSKVDCLWSSLVLVA